jgi:hypothetical protein
MANIGAFSAQIVRLVRSMPDDAILDLVRNQLGVLSAGTSPLGAARGGGGRRRRAAGPAPARGGRKRRGRRGGGGGGAISAQKQAAMASIEKVVRASSGLATSQIAKATKLPPGRVSAAIKELKRAKRIFQGGDRRFARYAGDAASAIKASEHARSTASGPIVKGRRRKKK